MQPTHQRPYVLVVGVLFAVGWAEAQYPRSSYPTGAQRRSYASSRATGGVDELARLLESNDHKQRLAAVEALGDHEDPRAVTALLKIVDDADPRIQARVIDHLGERRSVDAVPLLVQKLFLAGAPGALRQRVLTALGKIGDTSASRPILDFLSQEGNPDVRGTAVYALGEIGDLAVRDELRSLGEKETDPRLKQVVAEALAKMATARPATKEFVPPSSGLVPPLKPGS